MMPAGRPSKFEPEFVEQARKLAEMGATDEEVASFFEVDVRTIYRWKHENEEFCQSLKVGKEVADARVERSLYQRAVGYRRDNLKIFMPASAEEPVYAPYVEDVTPDVTAAIFWLKNRQPERWKDVSRHEQTGANGGDIKTQTTVTWNIVDAAPDADDPA